MYDASEYTLNFDEKESETYKEYYEKGIPEHLGYLNLDTLTEENKKKLKS